MSRFSLYWFALLLLAFSRGCSCREEPPQQQEQTTAREALPDRTTAEPQTSTDSLQPELERSPSNADGGMDAAKNGGSSRKTPNTEPASSNQSEDSAKVSSSGAGLDQAKQKAANASAAAERAAKAGDYRRAYEQALSGWEAIQGHAASDPESRQLAEALMTRLVEYGEAANRNAPVAPHRFKPLITR